MNATVLAMLMSPKLQRCVVGKRPSQVVDECFAILGRGFSDIQETRRLTDDDIEAIEAWAEEEGGRMPARVADAVAEFRALGHSLPAAAR